VIGLAACRIREGVLSGSASSQQGERQGGKRQKKTPQADFKRRIHLRKWLAEQPRTTINIFA
jgi:hypothetical protein